MVFVFVVNASIWGRFPSGQITKHRTRRPATRAARTYARPRTCVVLVLPCPRRRMHFLHRYIHLYLFSFSCRRFFRDKRSQLYSQLLATTGDWVCRSWPIRAVGPCVAVLGVLAFDRVRSGQAVTHSLTVFVVRAFEGVITDKKRVCV